MNYMKWNQRFILSQLMSFMFLPSNNLPVFQSCKSRPKTLGYSFVAWIRISTRRLGCCCSMVPCALTT